jgi:SAM-dependent methyltransferase
MKTAGQVYDEKAVVYDLRTKNPYTDLVRLRELRLIERFASGSILDAGCGTGFHLRALDNAVGVDISNEMVSLAKKTGMPVKKANIENLPFNKWSFDTALCLYSVLNVCDWKRAISELCRVTKPSGRIIISVSSLYDKGYRSLKEKRAVSPGRYTQTKRFHIDGERLWLHLFTRDELESEFSGHGLVLEDIDSVFRGVMPRWNLWKRLSLWDRLGLFLDRFRPLEYGAMYLMVFKREEQ